MTCAFSGRTNELSRQELARLAAPVCYAFRKARGARRLVVDAKERQCRLAVPQSQPCSHTSALRVRPRDAQRVDDHRAKLAAKGLRCKAPPFVPKDYIFLDPGSGWVPAKRGRRGRKALRAVHRGRKDRLHALPSVPRRIVDRAGNDAEPKLSLSSWAMSLPRQLRATRCPLSRYIESTMFGPPPGL